MSARRAFTPAHGALQNRTTTLSLTVVCGQALIFDLLGSRFALVENPHLDVARRLAAQILLPMDGAARDIVAVAGLEHLRGLPLDGEGDFTLLDRGPLVARM